MEAETRENITGILGSGRYWEEVLHDLVPLVFDDLRRLARYHMGREAADGTLQPTALANEVYLRLASSRSKRPKNRSEFFLFASRVIREILIDHARSRRAGKRGGHWRKVGLEEAGGLSRPDEPSPELLLTIDEVLRRLEKIDPRQCRVVELRYFVGLTLPQIADVLELSLATVERSWSAARLWLARALAG